MSTSDEQGHDLVSVGTADGQVEAEIIKGILTASGIGVWLSQESAGSALGLTVGPMGEVEIMVRTDQADEARALIESGSELGAED